MRLRNFPHLPDSRSQLPTRSRREEGFVITLMVFVLPVLLILIYFVLNSTSYPVTKARVQSASDAAAHGATFVLDPNDETTWDRSIIVAKSILRNFEQELGGFGDALEQDGPEYTDSDGRVTITIKRGRYMPIVGVNPSDITAGDFQSLEEEDLIGSPFEYLADLKERIANAVNVTIRLHNSKGIGALFAPTLIDGSLALSSVSIASETTVTFNQVEEWVAPFALPLCSLLDGESSFNPDTICNADRLFTTLEWVEKFSGVVPDFFYDPGRNSTVETRPDQCHFDSPGYYVESDNNYGALGLPMSDSEVDASAILNKLQETLSGERAGLVRAYIGQRFIPLSTLSGVEDIPETIADDLGTRLWHLISGQQGADEGVSPTFSDALGEVFDQTEAFVQPNWIPFPEADQPDGSGWNQRCGMPFRPENQIICGSRRFRWDCSSNELCASQDPDGFLPTKSVWRVKVPLIAEISAGRIARCSSGDSALLDPDTEYRIIGFLTVIVYDTDIGIVNSGGVYIPRPYASDLQIMMQQGAEGSICGGAFNVALPNFPAPPPPPNPPPAAPVAWGPSCASGGTNQPLYFKAAAPLPACNVIRARVDCNTAFEATKQAEDGTFSLRLVK